MGPSAAIVGASTNTWEACRDKRLEEMIFETTAAALAQAGITRREVDNVVLAANDELDGRSISSMLTAMPAGAVLKDEVKVTDSGLHSLLLASMRIMSGLFDVSLVVSWAKVSECQLDQVWRGALEPFFARDIGIINPIAAGIQAARYAADFHIAPTVFDAVAIQQRRRAGAAEDDGGANFIAYPLRAWHFAPLVDGVAAVVVASSSAVAERRFPNQPLWIRGLGWSTGSYHQPERGWGSWAGLRQAGQAALTRAAITLTGLDGVEIDDASSMGLMLGVEALGLAEAGQGGEWLLNGNRVVNRYANGFGGYPPFCAGLWRAARAFEEMPGSGAVNTLVAGTTGQGDQGHAVAILSREGGR